MLILKILFRNAFRNKLRTVLTILGITIAILAFGLLRTVISAWYAGVEASPPPGWSPEFRLLIFSFLSYKEKISQIPHVKSVSMDLVWGLLYR
jgi:putative ABC transport system permease protein